MDLGATLRHAREGRSLTSEDLARSTRIPPRMLLAMEQDDWAKLPGGIFTRGYLRAYAREVGIDGEELVARYEAEHAPPPPPVERPEPASTPAEWRVVVRVPRRDLAGRRIWQGLAWPLLAAGALLLAFYLAMDPAGPRGSGSAARLAGGSGAVAGPASSLGGEEKGARPEAPVGTASSATAGKPSDVDLPPPGPETPIGLELAVTRPCWVAVTADGTRTLYRIVQPGERERQRGREFVIRVGDAGALRLSIDGEPARPLGEPGEVATFRITRENYRTLLQAASAPI